jgi:hypothetical protein
MPTKRIIAYYMHEAERDAAVQYLSSARDAWSYLIGNVNEADIPALLRAGLVIEKVPDAPAQPARRSRRTAASRTGTRARRSPRAPAGPGAAFPRATAPDIGLRVLTFDVRLHRAEDTPVVLDWLDKHRAITTRSGQRTLRVYLPEDSPLVEDIPALKEVASFEQSVMGTTAGDNARPHPAIAGANP